MTEVQTQESLPIKLEPIVKQIQAIVPRMTKGRERTLEATNAITSIEDDNNLAHVSATIVASENTSAAMQALRKPVTEEFDNIKKFLMQFEKDVNDEAVRLRSLVGAYNQVKLDRKREDEAKAEKQKEKENHKVDITAKIKKNLADLVITRVKEVHEGSKKFWDETTLENWDAREKQFMSFKITLKPEIYNKCFTVTYNPNFLTKEEFESLLAEVGAEETYIKWDELVSEKIIPVVNEWRGKVGEIKQNLIDLKNAKDDEVKRKAIEAEYKKKADEEEAIRKKELEDMQKESDDNINREASIDKVQNDFREQAITQQLGEVGATKLIAKFKDDKPVKALTEVMYHCFMNSKFPNIIKVDSKTKQPKMDDNGFPVYVDWVDSLLSFFLKNCDVNIQGVEVKEISKVIIRK